MTVVSICRGNMPGKSLCWYRECCCCYLKILILHRLFTKNRQVVAYHNLWSRPCAPVKAISGTHDDHLSLLPNHRLHYVSRYLTISPIMTDPLTVLVTLELWGIVFLCVISNPILSRVCMFFCTLVFSYLYQWNFKFNGSTIEHTTIFRKVV